MQKMTDDELGALYDRVKRGDVNSPVSFSDDQLGAMYDKFAAAEKPGGEASVADSVFGGEQGSVARGLGKGGAMLGDFSASMVYDAPGSVLVGMADFADRAHGETDSLSTATRKAGEFLISKGKDAHGYWDESRQAINELTPAYRRNKDFIDDQKLLLNPGYMLEEASSAATSMLPVFAAAMAAPEASAAAVGGLVGGAMEGGGSLQQQLQDGVYPPEALGRSALYGMASAKLNEIGLDRILSKPAFDSLAGKALKVLSAGGTEAFTEWLEGPVQTLVEQSGKLPVLEDGSTVEKSARAGLGAARTPQEPKDMIGALAKSAREEAAVIPGSFLTGSAGHVISPHESSPDTTKQSQPLDLAEAARVQAAHKAMDQGGEVDLLSQDREVARSQDGVSGSVQAVVSELEAMNKGAAQEADAVVEQPVADPWAKSGPRMRTKAVELGIDPAGLGAEELSAAIRERMAAPVVAPEQALPAAVPDVVESVDQTEPRSMDAAGLRAEGAVAGSRELPGADVSGGDSATLPVGIAAGEMVEPAAGPVAGTGEAGPVVDAGQPDAALESYAAEPWRRNLKTARAKAKELGIVTGSKGRDELSAEIREVLQRQPQEVANGQEGQRAETEALLGGEGSSLEILNNSPVDAGTTQAMPVVNVAAPVQDTQGKENAFSLNNAAAKETMPATAEDSSVVADAPTVKDSLPVANENGFVASGQGVDIAQDAMQSPTTPETDRTQEQAGGMASPGQRRDFEAMVKDAAGWRGAAQQLAEKVKDDRKASMRLMRGTTKGDLDAYLMRKYGIDAAEARDASNALTSRNIPHDMTANVDDYRSEPWAKEVLQPVPAPILKNLNPGGMNEQAQPGGDQAGGTIPGPDRASGGAGDARKIGAEQENDSARDAEALGSERRDEGGYYEKDQRLVDEFLTYADNILDTLVRDGHLDQEEAYLVSIAERNDSSARVEDLAHNLAIADVERDDRLDRYRRSIQRISKAGGLGYDSVAYDHGKAGVQWMQSKFGVGFVTKNGTPLDVWAQTLSEEIPEAGIDGDASVLWDLLRDQWQSRKAILAEHQAQVDAIKGQIDAELRALSEQDDYVSGRMDLNESPQQPESDAEKANAPPSSPQGGNISEKTVDSVRDEYAALFDEELAAAARPVVPESPRALDRKARAQRKPGQTVKETKDRIKAGAAKMAEGLDGAVAVFSKFGGLSVRIVEDGQKLDETLYSELKPHLLKVAEGAREMGHVGKDLAREVVRFLIKGFGAKAAQAKPYFMRFVDEEILNQEGGNVDQQRGSEDLERDSGSSANGDGVGAQGLLDERGGAERAGGPELQPAAGTGRSARGGQRVSGRGTSAVGEEGDSGVRAQASESTPGAAGSEFSQRSNTSGAGGRAADYVADKAVERVAAEVSGQPRTGRGRAGKLIAADAENIAATLPTLFEGQHADVAFAERRFSQGGGGVLFTNGTGTGKTGSGLGIVKRMVLAGKKNILIAVPAEKIASDWIAFAGKYLDLSITKLKNTKDAGTGVVVTTHANMGMNNALAGREWDMIVIDEAHKLMSSEDAKDTDVLSALRALSLHRDGVARMLEMRHPEKMERLRILDKDKSWIEADELDKLHAWHREELAAVRKEFESVQSAVRSGLDSAEGRPGVVMLSATPFAYVPTVDYAEGYLFDYGDKKADGYNPGNARQHFFMQHFGYRMRYNKLTRPDANVDVGLMERQFNSWLKRQGVLSSRLLQVPHDYDRRFVLVESAIGRKIDEGLDWMRERKLQKLGDKIRETFDYHTRQYLLEALKVREVVPIIHDHLAKGRKVVVFHDFKKGGFARNPFDVSGWLRHEDEDLANEARILVEERKDLAELPIGGLLSPIDAMARAFPDVLLFNGSVSSREREAAVAAFQDDNSGRNVILVQSAAGEAGISLHDTTGKHQRVLINLGMPTRPVTAVQQEGRIYRVGQASDALFRYLNTGTKWERWAFAGTIAERASTAENLALGEEARALKDGFVQAFEDSDAWAPGHDGEGKGGKERDAAAMSALSDWDRAKTMYFAQQKKTSRTKSAEGNDYFATPEPLGLKMVEWAGIEQGMDVLEPSAGHGAIARWFPDQTRRVMVEHSDELASRLGLVAQGKIVSGRFEDHHLVNKYDAIVMNPPFGTAGKLAMEHVAKAFQHLRDGGRLVALIPDGSSMEKRFDAWLESDAAKDAHVRMSMAMPAVTFERAGTGARTRVVVIDRAAEPAGYVEQRSPSSVSGDTIKEFFDNLENRTAPERIRTVAKEADAQIQDAEAAQGNFFAAVDTKHTKTGADLFVASKRGSLSKEEYATVNAIAKDNGGYWSSFKGAGAVPGFTFKKRSQRDAFVKEAHAALQGREPGISMIRRKEGEAPAQGMKARTVQGVARAVAKEWKAGPEIVVVQGVEDLPEKILNAVRKAGAEGDVQALYSGGQMYLIADRMLDPNHIYSVMLHEGVGHHGLRLILSTNERNRALDAAWMNAKVQNAAVKIAAEYGLDLGKVDDRREAVEEVLANMAEDGVESKALDRFIALLRRAIRRIFGGLRLSDAEIREIISRARQAVVDGVGVRGEAGDGTMMQRGYHGSPVRDIEKNGGFKLEYRGTGEGRRPFDSNRSDFKDMIAWGHYVAGEKAVAEGYRERLTDSPKNISPEAAVNRDTAKYMPAIIDRMDVLQSEREARQKDRDQEYRDLYGDRRPTLQEKKTMLDKWGEPSMPSPSEKLLNEIHWDVGNGGVLYNALLKNLRFFVTKRTDPVSLFRELENTHGVVFGFDLEILLHPEVEPKKIGQLYELEIPEDHALLDWGKPLSEQPEQVRSGIENLWSYIAEDWKADALGHLNADFNELTGKDIYKLLGKAASDDAIPLNSGTPAELAVEQGNLQRAASEILLEENIKGVKYLDGNSRRSGEGTYNYVIFSDPDVEIVKTYYKRAAQSVSSLSTPMTPAQQAAELEKNRTFANKIHEGRDVVLHQVKVAASEMQREVQRLADSRKWKWNPLNALSAEKELSDSAKSRLLDMAMLTYRELQINPQKGVDFRQWAEGQLKTAKGADRVRILDQLRALDAAENLTAEQKNFVDTTMNDAFESVSKQAQSAGIVSTLLDNYVRRIWNRPQDQHKDAVFSGASHAFRTFTTASKARSLETIFDGWMKGYDLQIQGITSSWSSIAGEIGEIVANKQLIQEARAAGVFSTRQLPGYAKLEAAGFHVWARRGGVQIKMDDKFGLLGSDSAGRQLFVAPPQQVWALYEDANDKRASLFGSEHLAKLAVQQIKSNGGNPRLEFRQSVDVFERVPLHAPEQVAMLINRMTRKGSSWWQNAAPRNILAFNAKVKGWILMTSLFHHLNGVMGWTYSVEQGIGDALKRGELREAGKGIVRSLRPIDAHKRGLERIRSNDAMVRQGVKHGLTLGDMRDWSEETMQGTKGLTERLVEAASGRVPGAGAALGVVRGAKLFREKQANSLFKRLFAGMKAEAFCLEYGLAMSRRMRKGLPVNADLLAEQVAHKINTDFGDLHLRRLGRDPGWQKFLRLGLLAPDWTESNYRAATGLIPGLNETVSRVMGEVPPPPGMGRMYRHYWARIVAVAVMSNLLGNMLIHAFLGDQDDPWWKFYSEQFSTLETLRKMRWTGIDVSPIYKALGIDVPKDERKVFNPVRQFLDPFRLFLDPEEAIKAKGSPVVRIAGALGTKTDFRGRPYTNFMELLETGRAVKRTRYEDVESFWPALPSIIAAQLRDMQPIQVGYLAKYLQGEEDGLSALLSSSGAHISTAYAPDVVGQEFREIGEGLNAKQLQAKRLRELVAAYKYLRENDPDSAKMLHEQRGAEIDGAAQWFSENAGALKDARVYDKARAAVGRQEKRRRWTKNYILDQGKSRPEIDNFEENIEDRQNRFLEEYGKAD